MKLRLAVGGDLPALKEMYRAIVAHMKHNGIHIWNDVYPCEFFAEDIESARLYIAENELHEIIGAFALVDAEVEADAVQWQNPHEKALYLYRLGVRVDCLGQGVGSALLRGAAETAQQKNAAFLRLFVADVNKAAIRFYLKNHFRQAEGVYEDAINEAETLREFGFEQALSVL